MNEHESSADGHRDVIPFAKARATRKAPAADGGRSADGYVLDVSRFFQEKTNRDSGKIQSSRLLEECKEFTRRVLLAPKKRTT